MITILSFILTFAIAEETSNFSTFNDHLGKWSYTVEAPDMTYKGIMELTNGSEGVEGKMKADGSTIEMNDVVLDEDELSFTINVQGFLCKVKGTFSDNNFKGVVSVDGFELIMVASKEE